MARKTSAEASSVVEVNGTVIETETPVFGSLDNKLAEVLTINHDDYYETIESKTGTVEVTKKVIDLMNPIGNRTQVVAYDLKFIEATEKIKKAMQARELLTYVICKELSNLDESGILDKYGFKNTAEYGKAVFGFERQTVNHYVRIGKNFINDDYSIKGGLPNLSVGHFIELNSLVGENGELDKILDLYTTGTLTDGLSTKKVREKLNELKAPLLEAKEETADSSSAKENSSEATAEVIKEEPSTEELKAEFDSQVVVGQILNACTRIGELFSLLAENDIKATGYTESLDTIKGLAKTLLK